MSDQTSSPAVAPLTPPPPVAPVAPKTALAMVQLTPDQTAKLDAQVAEFASSLLSLPVHGDDFKTRVNAISAIGNAEIQRSASVSGVKGLAILSRALGPGTGPAGGNPSCR